MVKINGIDFSDFVQESSYKVNEIDVFDEWTDGNHIKHRVNYRQKIKGEFQLIFIKAEDFEAFMTAKKAKTDTDGRVKITVRVDNRDEEKEIDAFLDIESSKKILINTNYEFHLLDVELEEA